MNTFSSMHGLLLLGCLLYNFPIVAADGGDDFSNNLFSDLAPLIALFGEQVAKQYLSQSLHWLEHVIFACAPLGILTAVTCAIRVAGNKSLRAVIGRAREPVAQAEIEIMSSTSDDVCELWNGVGIVRVAGSPDILQLIYDRDNAGRTDDREPHRENDGSVGVYALHEAMKDSTENRVPDSEYHSEANEHNISLNTLNTNNDLETGSSNIAFSRSNAETDLQTGAPNISLNTSNSAVSKTELWVIALIGIFLQSGVLVLDAAATYYSGLQWKKGGRIVVGYAFPFTFIGTLGVVVGMFVCAYVIEASTKECTWKAKSDQTNMQILWIQRSQTVSDQRFKSYAIYAAKDRKFIMTSRPAPAKQFQFWTNVGTVISIGGFVLQFVGLRGMHFSASIAQLAATFIMTILRVLLRRNLTTEAKQYKEGEIPSGNEKQFSVKELPESHELDLVAMHMAGCKAWNIVTEGDSPNGSHDGDSSESAEQENYANAVSRVFRIRSRLSELAGLRWRGEMDGTVATLTETIDALMNHIWNHPGMISESEANSNEKVFQCRAKVDLATGNCGEGWVKPRIMRDNRGTPWKTNQADIDAIFSLWMYHLRLLRRNSDRGANLWLFNFAGGSSNDIGCTICDWWISRDIDSIEVPDLSSFCRTHNIHGSRILNCTTINNQSSAFPIQGMISSTTSLSHMCSQYILSAFLTAAAAWINPITSETTFHAIQGSRHLKVDNDDVRVLADIIQRSGLATFDDAYRIVVPALFEENSLPDLLEVTNAKKVLDVVKSPLAESSDYDEVICSRVRSLCIDKTSKMISAGKWTDAGNLCMELAGVFAEKLGPEHPETIKMRSSMRQFGERLASESRDPLNSSTTPSNVNLQTDEPKNIHTIKYPLHYAVQNGLEKNFYDILQQSNPSDIDGLCENGITPLGLATSQGNIYLVRLLLFFGANAAGPDKVKRSPLQLAAKTGRSGFSADKGDIIELLILNGANINGGDPTPLQVAVTSGSEDMAILLIERGANFNHMGPDGTSIIHLTAAAGCKAVLTLLLEKKVDPNLKDKGGLEVIHYAVFAGDDAVVRLLLEKKVDPNLKDNRGFAVIHYAVVAGGEVVVRLLLDNGADPDLSDSTGRTAMHWAVERGVEAVVRLLLEKGANLNTKDMDGRSVGYFAKGEEAVERLLKEYDGTRLKYERSVCGE